VRQAKLAEKAGFDCLWLSDHNHPWLDERGQSGFAWPVIGALSQVTRRGTLEMLEEAVHIIRELMAESLLGAG
jgi:hypothetical protein